MKAKKVVVFSVFFFCGLIVWGIMVDFITLTYAGEQQLDFFWNKSISFVKDSWESAVDFFQKSFHSMLDFLKGFLRKTASDFKDWVNEF